MELNLVSVPNQSGSVWMEAACQWTNDAMELLSAKTKEMRGSAMVRHSAPICWFTTILWTILQSQITFSTLLEAIDVALYQCQI